MDQSLLFAILKEIVVPELATFISQHFAKTGELPTQEELQTKIDDMSAQIVMRGEAFIRQLLDEHPELNETKDSTV